MTPVALPILVIDDNRDILTMLGIAMQRAGYQPTLVTTAIAGLQALTTTRFVAVLLDYGVSAETGHTLLTHVQQEAQPPVLILMTGHSWESLADHLTHVPLTAFLPKPFSIPTLYETLARSVPAPCGDVSRSRLADDGGDTGS